MHSEMVTPFPSHPGIEKRGVEPSHGGIWVWLSDTDAWDDTGESHNMSELAHQ